MLKKLNKKEKTLVVLLIIAVIASLAMTYYNKTRSGGIANRTLETYFEARPGEWDTLTEEIDQYDSKVVDASAEVKDNQLTYIYTYRKQQSDAEIEKLTAHFEEGMNDYERYAHKMIKRIKSKAQVNNMTLSLKYVNKDGSIIWAKDFEK